MFDDMEKTLRDWEHLGVLRVGASITVGSRFLPGYVKTFLSLHPGLEIRAQVAPTEALSEKIMANELDFALVEGVPRHPSLVSEDYMEDHLAVICPAGGPFRQGETITVEQFRAQRFLLREKGSGTREEFDRVTEQAGVSVSPSWEAMSTTALVNAVIEAAHCGSGGTGTGGLGECGRSGRPPPVPHHLPQGQIPARGGPGVPGPLPRF